MTEHRIDPELLQDYVDDRLDPVTRLEVARHLAANAGDRSRVEDYRSQNELLHQMFDPVMAESVPERLKEAVAARFVDASATPAPAGVRQRGGWRTLSRAAAVLVLLVGAGAAGWETRTYLEQQASRQAALDSFLRQAADAFSMYVRSDSPWGRTALEDMGDVLTWFEDNLGAELALPEMDGAGYSFKAGRALPSATGTAGQLVYRNDGDEIIAIYFQVRRGGDTRGRFAPRVGPSSADPSGHLIRQDDLSIYYWESDSLTYAMLGSHEPERFSELAAELIGGR